MSESNLVENGTKLVLETKGTIHYFEKPLNSVGKLCATLTQFYWNQRLKVLNVGLMMPLLCLDGNNECQQRG